MPSTLAILGGQPLRTRPFPSWPVFDVTGTIVDSANGVYTVALTPSATQFMQGDYQHQTWATDGSGNVSVVSEGRFRVRDPISSMSG